MNGLLVIDKPAGITSHDVVSRVRRILKTKRVGHTGTLDPFATGVMVLLVGKATRLAQFLGKDEKEYEAVVQFGFETNTGDKTGSRIADQGLSRNVEIESQLQSINWDDVFADFRGDIEQIPPMFSAKKMDGKKLYEHARKGEVVNRKPIAITIHKLEQIEFGVGDPQFAIQIRVVCSAGTYIRTLAEDIGRKIRIPAHLAELRRTRAGKFTIVQSITLEAFEKVDEAGSVLISMNEAVSHLPVFALSDERIERTKSGLSTRVSESNLREGDAVRMQDAMDNLIAVGFYDEAEKSVKPKVVLI